MHTCEDPRINKHRLKIRQSKMIDQRKPRKYVLGKWFKPPGGCNFFSEFACVYLFTHTLFPPNKHFTFLTTFCFFVEIHFHKADDPGPCHWPPVRGRLVARIPHAHCCDPTSVSSQELKSCFKPRQVKATWDQKEQRSQWKISCTSAYPSWTWAPENRGIRRKLRFPMLAWKYPNVGPRTQAKFHDKKWFNRGKVLS